MKNEELTEPVKAFCRFELFQNEESFVLKGSPFSRPLRGHILDEQKLHWEQPLSKQQILSAASLTVNRILFTIYELHYLLLPKTNFEAVRKDFNAFYSAELRQLGESIRSGLETFLFSWLSEEVRVTGNWTAQAFEAYGKDLIERTIKPAENPAMKIIQEASNPAAAARELFIQFALDFLAEASQMARYIPGAWGPLQSDLIKIAIDEMGFGVHAAKHSALYERFLTAHGLQDEMHPYFQFYLTSSLMLTNYFNWVTLNHDKVFRYLGAMFYVETAFGKSCSDVAKMTRAVFGADAEVGYWLEHVHIDQGHHSRMALKLCMDAIHLYGEGIIPDLVRGAEEAQCLTALADEDFISQIQFSDGIIQSKAIAEKIRKNLIAAGDPVLSQTLVELRGKVTSTHVHDADELCFVEKGTLRFISGYGYSTSVNAGEGILIKKSRLHGSLIDSDECTFKFFQLQEAHKWMY